VNKILYLGMFICGFFLTAGCGIEASDYQWVSSDPKIASVNALGVVYVKGEGQTVVRAMGLTNPMNADEVIGLFKIEVIGLI
jgi:hypothetical protein